MFYAMLSFKPNIPNIILRAIMLILIVIIFLLTIPHLQAGKITIEKVSLYFFAVIQLYLFVLLTATLLCVTNVRVDTARRVIVLGGFFYKKNIPLNEIMEYYTTRRRGPFYGILLYIENNKPVQLDERNIIGIVNLRQFLDANNVAHLGEKKPPFPLN
jgi:hypothetical protein